MQGSYPIPSTQASPGNMRQMVPACGRLCGRYPVVDTQTTLRTVSLVNGSWTCRDAAMNRAREPWPGAPAMVRACRAGNDHIDDRHGGQERDDGHGRLARLRGQDRRSDRPEYDAPGEEDERGAEETGHSATPVIVIAGRRVRAASGRLLPRRHSRPTGR